MRQSEHSRAVASGTCPAEAGGLSEAPLAHALLRAAEMKRLHLRLTALVLACFGSIGATACSGESSGGGSTTTETYQGQNCYWCDCTCDGAPYRQWHAMATIAQSTCDAQNGTSCADGGAPDGGGGPTLQGCMLGIMTHCN